MRTRELSFSILKEEISQDNVLDMAELIAIAETRFQIMYIGQRMEEMHNDLYKDIRHKHEVDHVFSDGYDLVQKGALFLCEHYGQHLSDILFYDYKGKAVNIEMACIRKMMRLINRKMSDSTSNVSYDALTPISEPYCVLQEELDQDYTQYDKIVASLNLTENMRIALEYRISGMSYPEIGKALSRAQSTVYEYFIKMRQRYLAIYGNDYTTKGVERLP